eukprot:scaffold9562_cov98-Isochrysis_galbana.AAC.5
MAPAPEGPHRRVDYSARQQARQVQHLRHAHQVQRGPIEREHQCPSHVCGAKACSEAQPLHQGEGRDGARAWCHRELGAQPDGEWADSRAQAEGERLAGVGCEQRQAPDRLQVRAVDRADRQGQVAERWDRDRDCGQHRGHVQLQRAGAVGEQLDDRVEAEGAIGAHDTVEHKVEPVQSLRRREIDQPGSEGRLGRLRG